MMGIARALCKCGCLRLLAPTSPEHALTSGGK
jgi:hypothetical protein